MDKLYEVIKDKVDLVEYEKLNKKVDFDYRRTTINLIKKELKQNFGNKLSDGKYTFYMYDIEKNINEKEIVFLPIIIHNDDFRELEFLLLNNKDNSVRVCNTKIYLVDSDFGKNKKYKIVVDVQNVENIENKSDKMYASNKKHIKTISRLKQIYNID